MKMTCTRQRNPSHIRVVVSRANMPRRACVTTSLIFILPSTRPKEDGAITTPFRSICGQIDVIYSPFSLLADTGEEKGSFPCGWRLLRIVADVLGIVALLDGRRRRFDRSCFCNLLVSSGWFGAGTFVCICVCQDARQRPRTLGFAPSQLCVPYRPAQPSQLCFRGSLVRVPPGSPARGPLDVAFQSDRHGTPYSFRSKRSQKAGWIEEHRQ